MLSGTRQFLHTRSYVREDRAREDYYARRGSRSNKEAYNIQTVLLLGNPCSLHSLLFLFFAIE